MGMDLNGAGLHYNWGGWRWLVNKIDEWGVDTSEFCFYNSGKPISERTCKAVANAIEQHRDEYIDMLESSLSETREQLKQFHYDDNQMEKITGIHPKKIELIVDNEILAWRNCRGCEQW